MHGRKIPHTETWRLPRILTSWPQDCTCSQGRHPVHETPGARSLLLEPTDLQHDAQQHRLVDEAAGLLAVLGVLGVALEVEADHVGSGTELRGGGDAELHGNLIGWGMVVLYRLFRQPAQFSVGVAVDDEKVSPSGVLGIHGELGLLAAVRALPSELVEDGIPAMKPAVVADLGEVGGADGENVLDLALTAVKSLAKDVVTLQHVSPRG